jgi:hypothetical protein
MKMILQNRYQDKMKRNSTINFTSKLKVCVNKKCLGKLGILKKMKIQINQETQIQNKSNYIKIQWIS